MFPWLCPPPSSLRRYSAKPPRIGRAPHESVLSTANRVVSKLLLPLPERQPSRRSTFRSRPKPCRSGPVCNLGPSFRGPSRTGYFSLRPERQALGLARLSRRSCHRGYIVSRHGLKRTSAWRLDRSLAHS